MKNLNMILMSLSLFTLACSEKTVLAPETGPEDIAAEKLYWTERNVTFGLRDGNFGVGKILAIWFFREGAYHYEEWMQVRPDNAKIDLNLDRLSIVKGGYTVYHIDEYGYHYICERSAFPDSWYYSFRDGEKYESTQGSFHMTLLNVAGMGVINGVSYNAELYSDERLASLRQGEL
jgi:hypothetical protein